uniref:F-box domain-containing protein n=1 Tax=Aedes aegypti TaxID=7159 RepID=A0A0P6IX95_AEDAE
MSWDCLPQELYEHIFKNLDFDERKPVALVCRRWNRAVFSRPLCRSLCMELSRGVWDASGEKEQVTVVDDAVVEASERDYRTVYVKWCKYSSPEVLTSINRLLRELAEKCLLEGLTIDAPLGQMLSDFFQTHKELLARIQKLQVSTGTRDNGLKVDQCVLKMDHLQTLFWREIVPGALVHNEKPVFVIEAPQLHSAIVKFGDSDLDRRIAWHNSFMELNQTSTLKSLKVHLHPRMWNQFFKQRLEALEDLTIHHRIDEEYSRDWDGTFSNMTNLKSIQMRKVNDVILNAINRHCSQLRILLLDNVDLTDGFLSVDRVFPQLEHFRLETAEIQSNKTLYLPSLKHLEWFNVKNLFDQSLTLAAPMLRTLRQSRDEASDFILTSKSPLEKLQLDLHESDIPEHFFQPFPDMRELSIRVSSAQPDLSRMIPHFRNITEFVLIAYNAPLQCDQMLNEMFKHCNNITSMTLCGFNPNLELSFPVFAQIFRNRNLKSLKLFGLTITGNSFPVQLHPGLQTFELRQVKVMDVAFGAYVFPPDEPHRVVCLQSDDCCSFSSSDCE